MGKDIIGISKVKSNNIFGKMVNEADLLDVDGKKEKIFKKDEGLYSKKNGKL